MYMYFHSMLELVFNNVCLPFLLANSIRPSCWSVLPQGNSLAVVAAIEDKVYLMVPFEVVQLVCNDGFFLIALYHILSFRIVLYVVCILYLCLASCL